MRFKKQPFFLLLLCVSAFLSFRVFLSPEASSQTMKRLTLTKCLEIAMERNPVINSARESLTRSRLQTREAYSSIFPKLSTNLEYTHIDSSDSASSMFAFLEAYNSTSPLQGFALPEDNYSFSIDLMQPVYDQGKYSVLKKQAALAIHISELDLEYVKQEISFGVIRAYLNTLKTQEMITIARESMDRLAEHLRVTKRRFEVGQVAKNDVLRAEMELANSESELIHAQKAASLNNEYLQEFLFMEDEPFTTLPLAQIQIEERNTEDMVALAYQKRSDYLKAVKYKELSKEGISLAKTDFFPFLSLFGQYKRSGDEFFSDEEDIIVGGKIELPIFEGGIRSVKLRRARHDFSLSEYQEAELKRQIKVEVVEALLNIEDLQATLKAIDKQIEHAQENLRIVQLRYQEGEATNLDTIDANLLLVKAGTDLTTLNYDIIEAKFAMLKAVGDLGMDRIRQILLPPIRKAP